MSSRLLSKNYVNAWLLTLAMFSLGKVTAAPKRANVEIKEQAKAGGSGSAEQGRRSTVFIVEVERRLLSETRGAIKTYERQMQRMCTGKRPGPSCLKILNRTLELYSDLASLQRGEEEREYDKALARWQANGRRGKSPAIDTKKSFGFWRNVISQADKISKTFPKNKDADRVIFTRAFAYQYIGREEEAAKIYSQLIANYPNSDVAGDAYASLGDYYFDRSDFRKAKSNFTGALKYPKSNRYLWSMFKTAWCDYNLGRNDAALQGWMRLVDIAPRFEDKGKRLKEEALRDMVFAFARKRDVKGAVSYYERQGGQEFIGPLLQLLAKQLADNGDYKEAVSTLKMYQSRFPEADSAPEAQRDVVQILFETNNFQDFWPELELFSKKYGRGSRWAQANEEKKDLVLQTAAMVKDQTLYYAKVLHQKAQKEESIPLHKMALKGYLVFLDTQKGAKETAEVYFNLADIYYFLKLYANAGKTYFRIVRLGVDKAIVYLEGGKTKNIHSESALYMVDAFSKDFEPEFKNMRKLKADGKSIPLTKSAKNYIDACAAFQKYYPKDEKINKGCAYDAAQIYFLSGRKEQAKTALWVVATKYSKEKQGKDAAESLVLLDKDDKPKLVETAKRLLAIPAFASGELGKKLKALLEEFEVEAISGIKDNFKKAKEYEMAAKKRGKAEGAEKLWYNASVFYIKAGAIDKAIEANLVLSKEFATKPESKDVFLDLGKLYEKKLELGSAANYYFQYYKRNQGSKEALAALLSSCDLLTAFESSQALEICAQVSAKDKSQGLFVIDRLLGQFARKDQKSLLVSTTQTKLVPLNPTAGQRITAFYRIYLAFDGQGPEAKAAASDIMATYKKNPKGVSGAPLRYVGELLFANANAALPDYARLKLKGGTVAALQGSIEAKSNALLSIKKTYEGVIASGDSYWSVAAFHQLGLAHEQLASFLEMPPEITGAAQKDVAAQLAPTAKVFKTKAGEYFKTALDTVEKFNIHSEWSLKSFNSFNRYSGKMEVFDDFIMKPDFLQSDVPSDLLEEVRS